MDEQRSRETRARAEAALVRLLQALRDEDIFLVVLGRPGAEVLASNEALVPEHLGTTDVDVLLITHVDPDADLGAVEQALGRLDFEPDPSEDGWRWRGPIEGVPVMLEFLCDLPDYREGEVIRPSGCRALGAQNLRGTGYVARDFAWEELSGELADGTLATVRVRFAGLEGYLLSKCVAARIRAATKDYYDLVYVLQRNRAGGPEQAAHRLLNGEFAANLNSLRTTFLEVRERYVGIADSRAGRLREAGFGSAARGWRDGTASRCCRRSPAVLRGAWRLSVMRPSEVLGSSSTPSDPLAGGSNQR